MPKYAKIFMVCDSNGKNIRIEADKSDIRCPEEQNAFAGFDYPYIYLDALSQKNDEGDNKILPYPNI